MPLSRRTLLRSGLIGASTLAMPRRAAATVSPEDRKLIFVMIFRGWDPTRVFASEFDNPDVAMEAEAQLGEIGGIRFVDHAERPSVRSFLETWHANTLFLNGVVVPSPSHLECLKLMMTGSNQAGAPDWPARAAYASRDRYALPHVVIRGPQFGGEASSVVTRIGTSGYVSSLLDGSVLAAGDVVPGLPSDSAAAVMERHLQTWTGRRAARAVGERDRLLTEGYEAVLGRAQTLKSVVGDVRWAADGSVETQADLAIDLFRLGLTRCVTLSYEALTWDSHDNNDLYQSANFETLFAGLGYLMEQLALTPGEHAPTLADETVVVVCSEMGRTPQLNGGDGKDHWSHTSLMITGPGITGDRVVGGFSEYYYGKKLDLATAETSEDGVSIYPEVVGATILELLGVDPGAALPGVSPLLGVLA